MQYVYPLNGVYHTHWYVEYDDYANYAHQYPDVREWRAIRHEAAARDEASDTLYTDILCQDVGDLLICPSTAREQVLFELDAYTGEVIPHKLPRKQMCNRAQKHARLWDDGRWDVQEKRFHAAHRYGRGGGWKAHRRYQARNR